MTESPPGGLALWGPRRKVGKMPAGGQRWCWPLGSGCCFSLGVVMSGSSFVVPSAVFSGLSALSGPVAVVGSRSVPAGALLSVARFGRWVGRSRPLWSGGALGVDCAASAGALAQSGQVCWWLPAGFGELTVGSSSPVVRGPGGVFPVSAPRQLARSVRCVAWAGGPSSASVSFSERLFQRSVSLLLSLRGAGGGSVVCFIAQSAFSARRGGSWFSVRRALGLGFRPGVSLFVVAVGSAGFQLLSPGAVRSAFSASASSSQQSLFTPEQLVGARPSLFPPVSPSGSRRDPHGERFDSQSVCGPLSQSFWLGLRHG